MMFDFLKYTLILSLVFFGCEDQASIVDIRILDAVEAVRKEYAPDKRVAIFDVEVIGDSVIGETNLVDGREALLEALGPFQVKPHIRLLMPEFGLVNVSVCNIRSLPKHSAELATQSLLGTLLRIYKREGSWFYVQTPDGYLGWLDGGAIVALSPDEHDAWIKEPKIVVKGAFGLVYTPSGEVMSDVVEGDILRVGKRTSDYSEVIFPDGRMGHIGNDLIIAFEDFVKLKEPLLEDILETAHSFMGRPYLWGGTSGKGMDCSGFTKSAFYLNALELPRDASQQVNVGDEVQVDTTLQNLRRGDFIFFGKPETSTQKERITHVAIYLGDGKIIHASEMVQVQSLRRGDPDFAEDRLLTMVRAKRMLDKIGENGVIKLEDHALYDFGAR